MSITTEQRRLAEAISPGRQRSEDVRFALLLTYITLGWMTIEGAASLLLGWASKSLLLEAFGIDSVIELFSAAVLLWRLRVEASGAATFSLNAARIGMPTFATAPMKMPQTLSCVSVIRLAMNNP